MDPRRNSLRNSFVVPYWTGRPGASFLPTSLTRSFSRRKRIMPSAETPRIASISGLVMGWE